MRLDYAALTDPGRARSHNEDSVLALELDGGEAFVFAVADGVGGLDAGDEASRTVVGELSRTFTAEAGSDDPAGLLVEAIQRANEAIAANSRANGGSKSGSTVVAMVLWRGGLAIAHAGDSRAYRLDGTALEQLTADHSLVAEQVRAGIISEAQAANHARKNVITRSVGISETLDVETTGPMPLTGGAVFLLCSDGLHGVVEPSAIASTLAEGGPAEETCRQLIHMANQGGGPDNIGVVLVRVHEV